jgi:hypothetical protein
MDSEQTSDGQRGRPFPPGHSGNLAGRPRGARNRSTLAAEQLLDGEAEGLTRKVIELAQNGDITALRLCMDRILPVRRDRFLLAELPPLKSVSDAPDVIAAIVAAVGAGELGIADAMELAGLVDLYVRTKQSSLKHAELLDAQEERQDRKAMLDDVLPDLFPRRAKNI